MCVKTIPEHRLNNIKMSMIADLLIEHPDAVPIRTRGEWGKCFTIHGARLNLWYDRPIENGMTSGLVKRDLKGIL